MTFPTPITQFRGTVTLRAEIVTTPLASFLKCFTCIVSLGFDSITVRSNTVHTIPMSQRGYDAQAHVDSQWQSQDLNPGRLGPEPAFLTHLSALTPCLPQLTVNQEGV